MKKQLMTYVLAFAFISTLSGTAMAARGPAASTHDGYACTHNTNSSVRMRANAGTNFKIINSIPSGTGVNIITSKTGSDGQLWYKISYGRTTGWARYDYICTN